MARKLEPASNVSVSSPLPTTSAATSSPQHTFPAALNFMCQGKSFSRLEWADPKILVCIKDDYLMYRKGGIYYQLILRKVDIEATDWVVVENSDQLSTTSTTP